MNTMTNKRNFLVEPNLRLPLWRNVLFIDWHGVLCDEPFWSGLLSKSKGRNYKAAKQFVDALFSDSEFLDGWLRGTHTTSDILSRSYIPSIPRAGKDYFVRQLHKDCLRMQIDDGAEEAIQKIRAQCLVVLATDNMDCFARIAIARNFSNTFDDILCSSELGCLKQDAAGFFGAWLAAHNMTFGDAVLVDDSEANCAAFERAGGKSAICTTGDEIAGRLWGAVRPLLSGMNV